MSEETISHETNGSVFISLKRIKDGEDPFIGEDEWSWFVQISDKTDTVDEHCSDEHAARALYRNLCFQNGINVGYQPLAFVVEQSLPADPAQAAVLVYQRWTQKLFPLIPGSEEALKMRDEMVFDYHFQEHAQRIVEISSAGTGWIAATIRSSARVAVAAVKTATENKQKQMMDEIPGFGEF